MFRLFILVLALSCGQHLAAQIAEGALVINEFVADNDSLSGIADPDGGYPDWIELYNNTDQDLDLTDVYLSDKPDRLLKFRFPAGTIITANGYLIVWADEDGDQQGIHANFKLSRNGEAIYLSNAADSSRIDAVVFGEQQTNVSAARVPNGTGEFVNQHTTHGFSNDTPVSTIATAEELPLVLSPNPVSDWLRVELPGTTTGPFSLEVITLAGRTVVSEQLATGMQAELNLQALSGGFYLLRVRDGRLQERVVRLVKR